MDIAKEGKGLLFVILSGFLWSSASIFSKYLLSAGCTSILVILVRNFSGALLLGLILLLFQRKRFYVAKEDLGAMFLCCVFVFLHAGCYFFSLYFLNASVAVMLLYLYPSIVVVASVFLYGERLTAKVLSALFLTLLGLALTLNLFRDGFGSVDLPGLLLGLTAAVGAAFYCIYIKKLSPRYHSFTISFYGLAMSVVVFGLMLPFFDLEPMAPKYLLITVVSSVPYVCAFLCYAAGVACLRPSFASIFGNSEVVFNVVLATVCLGEAFSLSQGMGMVLIIGAIVLLEWKLPGEKRERKN